MDKFLLGFAVSTAIWQFLYMYCLSFGAKEMVNKWFRKSGYILLSTSITIICIGIIEDIING